MQFYLKLIRIIFNKAIKKVSSFIFNIPKSKISKIIILIKIVSDLLNYRK